MKYFYLVLLMLVIDGAGLSSSYAKSEKNLEKSAEDTTQFAKATKGVFLNIQDQELSDLAFSVAEISNYFAGDYLDQQGVLFFLAGRNFIEDRKVSSSALGFMAEEQKKEVVGDNANAKNCYIRKHFFGSQPVVFGIANINSDTFDENRKCLILTFAYFTNQSLADLQSLETKEIFPLYFKKLLEEK